MELLFWLIELLITMFEIYIGFQFTAITLEKEAKRISVVLCSLLIAVIICMINLYSLFTQYTLFVGIFLSVALRIYLYRIKWRIALANEIFYSINFMSVIDVSCILMASFLTSNEAVGRIMSQNLSPGRVLVVAVCKLVLYVCFRLFRNIVKVYRVKRFFTDYWWAVIIIGVISFFGLSYLNTFIMSRINSSVTGRWIFFIVLLIAIFVALVLHHNFRVVTETKVSMEMRHSLLEANYNALKQITDAGEKSAHDFKNHLNMLHKYLAEQNIQAALSYVASLKQPLESMEGDVWTGNEVLDFILNVKRAEAEENGIRLHIDTKLYSFYMRDQDLNSILSNVLDNAIEASKALTENKVIDVYIHSQHETLVIKVKNFHQNIILERGKKLISSKEDKKKHGLGVSIVKNTVERYGGYMDIQYDEHIFLVLITIPMRSAGDIE